VGQRWRSAGQIDSTAVKVPYPIEAKKWLKIRDFLKKFSDP